VTLSSVARAVLLQVLAKEPGSVARDGTPIPKLVTAAQLDVAATGWRVDSQTGFIFIKFQHTGGVTKIIF